MDAIMNDRYPGSRPFEDTPVDRRLFFGREHEKQVFFHTVLAEQIVVLYAKSGIGKTSFLNAGLMQLLREKDFLPIVVRFNDMALDPLEATIESFKAAAHHSATRGDEEKSLWQHFNSFEFKTFDVWDSQDVPLTPVLILDQFEEFFTLHAPGKRTVFTTQLAELLKDREFLHSRLPSRTERAPKLKIIISLREEYLGQLEEMSDEIPGILHNRFRLLALTREQAQQAIEEPAKLHDKHLRTKSFRYAPETIEAMVDFLCQQRRKDDFRMTDEIEPFQLQLLCLHIEKTTCKTLEQEGRTVVQESDLGGEAEMQFVLKNFYNTQINQLKSRWKRRRVCKLCEKGLISVTNRRLSLEEEEIERGFKVSKDLLVELDSNRLLRSERRVGSFYYELSHDTLIQPIRTSQKERQTRYEKLGGVIVLIIAVLFMISFAVIEYTSWGQIGQVKKELFTLSKEIRDGKTLSKAAIAFANADELEQACEIATKIETFEDKVTALLLIARVARASGKFDRVNKAEDLLRETLKTVVITEDGVVIPADTSQGFTVSVSALPMISEALKEFGDSSKAEILLKQTLENTIEYSENKVGVVQTITEAAVRLGDADKAQAILKQTLKTVTEIEYSEDKTTALQAIAEAFEKLGDGEKAEELLERTLDVAATLEFPDAKAAVFVAVAGIFNNLGDVQKAEELLERTLDIAATLEFPDAKAAVLVAVAEAFGKLGGGEKARALLEQTLDVVTTIESLDSKAVVFVTVAEIFSNLGDSEKVRALLGQTLDVAATIDDSQFRTDVLLSITRTFGKLGDVKNVGELLEQSLQTAAIIEEPDRKDQMLLSIARTYANIEHWQKATQLVDQMDSKDNEAKALAAILSTWADKQHHTRQE